MTLAASSPVFLKAATIAALSFYRLPDKPYLFLALTQSDNIFYNFHKDALSFHC